jgi:hypothetical protein
MEEFTAPLVEGCIPPLLLSLLRGVVMVSVCSSRSTAVRAAASSSPRQHVPNLSAAVAGPMKEPMPLMPPLAPLPMKLSNVVCGPWEDEEPKPPPLPSLPLTFPSSSPRPVNAAADEEAEDSDADRFEGIVIPAALAMRATAEVAEAAAASVLPSPPAE